MNSDTKLSADQKDLLKNIKLDAKFHKIKWANNGETTIAWKHMGNTVRFAMSVKSPDEIKFRRKVGEFQAINRLMWDDEYTIMNRVDFDIMMESVLCIDLDSITGR